MTPAELLAAINLVIALAQMPAGDVKSDKLKSLHDVGATIVQCYHPSAIYSGVEVTERPWAHGKEWRAESSALLLVQYRGNVLRLNHRMLVAMMQRGDSFMVLPLDDSNPIPLAKDCALKNWVSR